MEEEWHTKATINPTGAEDEVGIRAFQGDYFVTIRLPVIFYVIVKTSYTCEGH